MVYKEIYSKNKDIKITIQFTSNPEHPRYCFDIISKMYLFGKDKYIGEDHNYESMNFLLQHIKNSNSVYLPIYIYEHDNINIYTHHINDFDCRKSGYIFIPEKTLEKEKLTKEQAIEIINSEIKLLNAYLNGDVFNIIISELHKYKIETKKIDLKTYIVTFNEEIIEEWDEIDSLNNIYGYEEMKNEMLCYISNCYKNTFNEEEL